MPGIRFVWDPRKAKSNASKHGVTFEEATTAFADEHGMVIPDPDHSDDEDRFILLGFSSEARLLVVCHCYRETQRVIRIISARKATRTEQSQYGG
jgi:uncharacterized DUF497 family protein